MNKRLLHVLLALSVLGASSFAAKERIVRFQNHVRLGYDDNIYGSSNEQGSGFITDIINLSTKLNFSSRSDALFYWQPEFQYRFDADPKFITYQDLYARLNHAVSQRSFVTVSDRFRYQNREGQTGIVGGGTSDFNANFIENDLQGSLEYTLNTVSYVKVGGGYEFRTWDDGTYGTWNPITMRGGNDYDQIKADASYIRQLKPNKTQGLLGVNYSNLEYDGSRGGFDSVALMGGIDQNFNPNVTGYGRLGYQFTTIDSAGGTSEDANAPYAQAGLEVNPSARTSFNGSLGYSIYRSENSGYNAQDRFNIGIGARHDLTAKVSLAASLSHIYSLYDGSYSVSGTPLPDAIDNFFEFSMRCTYQVNRNNFLEAGYLYANRSSDFTDWSRNRVDVAWRLRL